MHRLCYIFFISLITIFMMASIPLYAYDFQSGSIYYNINDDGNTVYVTKGDVKYSGDIVIPSNVTYNGETYNVTSIGKSAFYYCSGLTNIIIPNSVLEIGNSAFYYCGGLKSITIPNSVTSIGISAFSGCSGLTSVIISNSITEIGNYAFSGCKGLTSITIPNSVKSIGTNPFSGCSSLETITVENDNNYYDSRNNCNAIINGSTNQLISSCKSTIIPNSVTSIGNSAFSGCTGLTSIIIPNSVTSIGNSAFSGSGLTSITIPNSVSSVGNQAFSDCSDLTSVTIPNSVTRIEDETFRNCCALNSISIPNSVVSIGRDAFYYCGNLQSITIPNSVTRIDGGAFRCCLGLTSITIPNSVTQIGGNPIVECDRIISVIVEEGNPKYDSRYNCNAIIQTQNDRLIAGCNNTVIPPGIKTIGSEAFANASLITAIPCSVTQIEGGAFYNCRMAGVVIPPEVRDIGDGAFSGACFNHYDEPTSLYIPNKVESIGLWAFEGCKSLYSVTIPSSVKRIRPGAFQGCSRLEVVVIRGAKPISIDEDTFTNRANAKLYVPVGCKDAYQAAPYWNEFKEIIETTSDDVFSDDGGICGPEMTWHYVSSTKTLTFSGTGYMDWTGEWEKYKKEIRNIIVEDGVSFPILFDNFQELVSVYLPSSIEGSISFSDCRQLRAISIPYSVWEIGFFRNCALESICIPSSINYILGDAFGGTRVKYIIVEKNNRQYDSRDNCNAIIETESNTLIKGCMNSTIPNSVTSIGGSAFANCSGLTSITIPNSVTSIGYSAFYGCIRLSSITIPNSVTSIGGSAFSGCSGLTSAIIPNSITEIFNSTFSGCKSLTSITIPNSVTTIGNFAFQDCHGLTSITIPYSVTSIGTNPVSGCSSLETIIVENDNNHYDSRNNCNAIINSSNELISGCKSTMIPNSVTSIGDYAFSGCSDLTSIPIPTSITSIGNYSYSQCSSLTSITIPNSVTSIGSSAFSGCKSLTSVTIPNSLTNIGNYSFYKCSTLSSITIPNSVTSIGNYAFFGCNGLQDVISEIQIPFEIKENVFSTYSTTTLTVPKRTKAIYEATNNWNKFTSIVENEAINVIQGDVNGDQEVNVSDIVEVVNYINNNASAIFLKNNADLNGDGEVNVTDIVWMVNIIMSGQTRAARKTSNRAGDLTDGDCLTIEDLTLSAGETKQVSVILNNPDKKYTAFQFDLTLPDGISIARNSNGKLMASLVPDRIDDHTQRVAETGDNTYRLLAFSMSNAEFYGTGGALVNITLQADENVSNGAKAALLRSQVFTATNGVQYKWADKEFGILVNDSENTGIDEILQNSQKGSLVKVYTLTGLLMFSVPQSGFADKWQDLPSGVYIVNGQKMIKSDDAQNNIFQ